MASKNYSEKIAKIQVMIDGLKEYQDNLPAGVKPNVLSDMESMRTKAIQYNSEQESIKAELKKKTEQFNAEMEKLEKLYADTKKRVKLDVEQSLWRKFGIEDKR